MPKQIGDLINEHNKLETLVKQLTVTIEEAEENYYVQVVKILEYEKDKAQRRIEEIKKMSVVLEGR